MKRRTALLALAAALTAGAARAQSSSGIVITVTPSTEYGVIVASTSLAYTLAVGAPALTPAIGVQIVGSQQPVELDVSGSVTASSNTWSLATNETPATDLVRVYALFTSTTQANPPAPSDFTGSTNRLVTGVPLRASGSNGTGTNYMSPNDPTTMDHLPQGAQRSLWLRFDAPPASSTARPQTVTVTLTATVSNL